MTMLIAFIVDMTLKDIRLRNTIFLFSLTTLNPENVKVKKSPVNTVPKPEGVAGASRTYIQTYKQRDKLVSNIQLF